MTMTFSLDRPRAQGLLTLGIWGALVVALAAQAEPSRAQTRIEAEAFSGTPFGVGRVTIYSGGDIRMVRPLARTPRESARPGIAQRRDDRNGVAGNAPERGGPLRGAIRRGDGTRLKNAADLARRIAGEAGVTDGGGVLGGAGVLGGLGGEKKDDGLNLESAEISLVEKSTRTFYPVFEKRDRPILREFLSVPTQTTIYFLFKGESPLDLTVYTPEALPGRVDAVKDPARQAQLLRAWWAAYSAAANGSDGSQETPPMVEQYLAATLSRRLQLPMPPRPERKSNGLLQDELGRVLDNQPARIALVEELLLSNRAEQVATLNLPEELPAPKPEILNPPADIPIEPIAARVPVECFYVRFGTFPNFLWMRHRVQDWGGQLADLVTERGLDFATNERFQHQMGLRESALAEVLGDKVIADVALIGTDLSLKEGASLGMLFQARNSAALNVDLMNQRITTLKSEKDGKQEKLTIAGRQVSFFSTPDNSMRSFYVADGDYHLVTTSRALVEWFLATADGNHDSVAGSDAFRLARSNLPLARNDAVFAYLSPEFFANLSSPQYHIERERRLRSAVEIELVEIAQLAARGEQKPSNTIDELVAGGFLPAGFGHRPDGSQLVLTDQGWVDSFRGGRGSFVPVPDVKIAKITQAEADEYRGFLESTVRDGGLMDPIVVGVGRETLPNKLERVTIDLHAAPLSQKHIDKLAEWLGDPTDQRVAPIAGDVVSFDAVMRGKAFFDGGQHHLFGALRDADPSFGSNNNIGIAGRLLGAKLDGLQGYLGAWPGNGFINTLGGVADLTSQSPVLNRILGGMTRRQIGEFQVLSFHPEILDQLGPQLRFEKAERPAQIWIRAEDLARSKLAPMLNAYGYRQSRTVTQANTRMMNMMIDQLHVPPAEARATAEHLLAARFMSPLGGEYELRDFDGGLKTWVSTALADRQGDTRKPPSDYQFPALQWLRGGQFELLVKDRQLSAHAGLVMSAVDHEPAFKMPGLTLTAPKSKDKPAEKPGPKDAAAPADKPAARPKSAAPPKPAGVSPAGGTLVEELPAPPTAVGPAVPFGVQPQPPARPASPTPPGPRKF